ncbi:MAG: hypothetical protein LBP59_13750, partial [Planctomycetaceae bacterium]|jgi:hypothetical protein|nr:hypothetical protein [Planctomycetaceae bacterium]
VSWTKYSDAERFDKIAEAQTKRPPLARTRVNNFWGGVHKSFEVAGEGKYFVRVANNFCFCTILSSVCIDKLQGDSTINDKFELSLQLNVPYQPPQFPESISHPAAYQAKKLWDMFDNRYDRLGVVVIERDYRLRSIQTAANLPDNISKQLAQAMCWRLNLLDDQQRQTWNNALQEIQTRLIKQNPNHTSQQNELLNNTRNRTIWKYWKK